MRVLRLLLHADCPASFGVRAEAEVYRASHGRPTMMRRELDLRPITSEAPPAKPRSYAAGSAADAPVSVGPRWALDSVCVIAFRYLCDSNGSGRSETRQDMGLPSNVKPGGVNAIGARAAQRRLMRI